MRASYHVVLYKIWTSHSVHIYYTKIESLEKSVVQKKSIVQKS